MVSHLTLAGLAVWCLTEYTVGVINSPQLLELSGIGDPEVLSAAGVECKVENKGVGK